MTMSLPNRIRSTIVRLVGYGEYVAFETLKAQFPGTDLDPAIRSMYPAPDVAIFSDVDERRMSRERRAAAVTIGGEAQHLIRIVDPRDIDWNDYDVEAPPRFDSAGKVDDSEPAKPVAEKVAEALTPRVAPDAVGFRDETQDENEALERRIVKEATQELTQELQVFGTAVLGSQLRGASAAELRELVDRLLAGIWVNVTPYLISGSDAGRRLGASRDNEVPSGAVADPDLENVVMGANARITDHLNEAVKLSQALPMDTADDVMAVIAKSRAAVRGVETDAEFAVTRGIALGVADAAVAQSMNLVWVAERNACPACLAYQGHVVAPGQAFPSGLTYGDRPVKPYGKLIAPPLHPHCRCQLELSELEPGELDAGLAREAARSVARGLTDYQSEASKFRSVQKLLDGTTGLPLVTLPKSVRERAARNLQAQRFKARPSRRNP